MGELPIDAIQGLFASLDPYLADKKFRRFAELDPESPAAQAFVALEDWLNDGVPLAAPVARECLQEWYGENTPGRGLWQVADEPVTPQALNRPALVIVPERDHIVIPASAAALAEKIPGAECRTVPLGHIGMVVGGGARTKLWRPLARWLQNLP